jgi:hypothetical protein
LHYGDVLSAECLIISYVSCFSASQLCSEAPSCWYPLLVGKGVSCLPVQVIRSLWETG